MSLSRTVAFALTLCLCLGVAATAGAQAATEGERQRARAAFDEGRRLIENGRLARGRDRLLHSFALLPTAATAYNLAIAYRGTGEAIAGVSLLERLLAGEFGDLPPDKAAEAQALRDELREMTAQLAVQNETQTAVVVTLDAESDHELAQGEERVLPVDLGRHSLSARAEGHLPFEQSLRLGAGSLQRVTVQLEPIPNTRRPGRTAAFVLSGVAVVAAVVLTVLLVDRTAEPTQDPIFPTAMLP